VLRRFRSCRRRRRRRHRRRRPWPDIRLPSRTRPSFTRGRRRNRWTSLSQPNQVDFKVLEVGAQCCKTVGRLFIGPSTVFNSIVPNGQLRSHIWYATIIPTVLLIHKKIKHIWYNCGIYHRMPLAVSRQLFTSKA
jgi:hypothetical protein